MSWRSYPPGSGTQLGVGLLFAAAAVALIAVLPGYLRRDDRMALVLLVPALVLFAGVAVKELWTWARSRS